jgi:hypothetical protein
MYGPSLFLRARYENIAENILYSKIFSGNLHLSLLWKYTKLCNTLQRFSLESGGREGDG